MSKKLLLFILLLLFSGAGVLFAQKMTPEEREAKIKFWFGNEDLMTADELSKIGRAPDARPYYQTASDTFENQRHWGGFIAANIGLAETYQNTEEYEEGIEKGMYALQKIQAEAPDMVIWSYDIITNMGLIYYGANEYDLAFDYFSNTVKILTFKYERDTSFLFGRIYNLMGACNMQTGEGEKAIEYFEKAEKVLKEAQICYFCEEELASVYNNIGSFYRGRNRDAEAIEYLEKGLKTEIAHRGENNLLLAQNYVSLAIYYFSLSEAEQSNQYLKKAIFIIENSGTNEKYYTNGLLPYAYRYLAENDFRIGNLDSAIEGYRKAVKLFQKDKSGQLESVRALTGCGTAYVVKGHIDTAFFYLNQAEELFNTLPKDSLWTELEVKAQSLIYTAFQAAWDTQGDWDKAIVYGKKSVKVLMRLTGARPHDLPVVFNDLALYYKDLPNIDSALVYSQKALKAACKAFDSDDVFEVPGKNEFADLGNAQLILRLRADLIYDLAYNESDLERKQNLFSKALAFIDLGDEIHHENLRKISLLRGGESKSLFKDAVENYRTGMTIAFDYYRDSNSKEIFEKAFYYAQKIKAQELWLAIQKSNAVGLGGLDETLLEEEKNLLGDIHFYENKIIEATQERDADAAEMYENQYLFKSREAYASLQRKLETEHPEYYEAKYNLRPETAVTLQNVLSKGELLIEYIFADTTLFIFTIEKHKTPRIQKVSFPDCTFCDIRDMNELLKNASWMRKSSREKFIKLNHKLYQKFIFPIENRIAGKKRLIIIGDDLTNYLPFEVLLKSGEVKKFKDLDYLIKKYEISYHYSTTLFAKSRRNNPKFDDRKTNTDSILEGGIYAFAPVYDAPDEKPVGKTEFNSNLRAYSSKGNFVPLPESEREVKAIIELFAQNEPSGKNILALRADANEPALKQNLEMPYRFIHIAGHSFADLENPNFSGIACFQAPEKSIDASEKSEDGVLYTGEIYNLPSQADLVTLSSCESGFGKLETTEGLLGLNRAFIYGGTPNVVFSLWKVYDKVSAELMVNFYKNILDGKSYSTGLREAKLELLKDSRTAAPHFWSPYLLIGR